jgi:hypothetical protein
MAVATIRQPPSDPVLQFTVFIPNRLGRLHEVTRRLFERSVHILALTVLDTTDSTILRIIVDDPDLARSLLQEHAFAFTETPVVVVEIAGERQLQDVLSALVLNVEHPEVAIDSLRRHQFTVLYQGDVSR